MASAEAPAYNGVWRQRPQWTTVWGSAPSGSIGRAPDRRSGAKPSWSCKPLSIWASKGDGKFANFSAFCKFSSTDECWYDTLYSCCAE